MKALKGDILWSLSQDRVKYINDGYLVFDGYLVKGVFEELPVDITDVEDYSGKLIIPGMYDLHTHASQYAFRGNGMDHELIKWLEEYAFSEEKKFSDREYAQRIYRTFADELMNGATARAAVFATSHTDATLDLMNILEETGLECYVGRVVMDRNVPEGLKDSSADLASLEVEKWIGESQRLFKRTKPILTPRFLPSCSNELLGDIGELQRRYDLPVQSHLDENKDEIKIVKELFPDAENYAKGYEKYGLLNEKTIMAHCIYCNENEIETLKERSVYVAHCPASNANLSSGIAPIRKYLKNGINVGLGTDVGAGESLSMFRAIRDAIKVSKFYFRLIDSNHRPLKFEEAFYLATEGGGRFFGKTGSFKEGYEMDALVIDDSFIRENLDSNIKERVEKAIYLEADRDCISAKYVKGKKLDRK